MIEGKLDQSGNCSFIQCKDDELNVGQIFTENVLPLVGIDELQIRKVNDGCHVNNTGNYKYFIVIRDLCII